MVGGYFYLSINDSALDITSGDDTGSVLPSSLVLTFSIVRVSTRPTFPVVLVPLALEQIKLEINKGREIFVVYNCIKKERKKEKRRKKEIDR